jgi:hypothetical protein
MYERRGIYRVLARKPVGKRPRHRWENNINMDLQELGCGGNYSIKLAQIGTSGMHL